MKYLVLVFVIFLVFMGCTGIDCPLNNVVYTKYVVKNIDNEADTLRDTMSVYVVRSNETELLTVINRNLNTTSFILPISFVNDVDTFFFEFSRRDRDSSLIVSGDLVYISKTNIPHFESVDCSPNYFHQITGVRSTHNRIDTIEVNNKSVDYEEKDNFYIRFKALH